MRTTLCCIPLILLACIPACGNDEGGSSFGHYLGEMDESIDAVEASLMIHHDQVLASTDLDAIRYLERKHMEAMAMSMDRMERAQRGMALCGEHMSLAQDRHDLRPLMDQSDELDGMVEHAWDELLRHWRAMDEAPTVESATDEERGHRNAMREMAEQMRTHRDSMSDAIESIGDAASLMCPMYTHMHSR